MFLQAIADLTYVEKNTVVSRAWGMWGREERRMGRTQWDTDGNKEQFNSDPQKSSDYIDDSK